MTNFALWPVVLSEAQSIAEVARTALVALGTTLITVVVTLWALNRFR